MSIRRLLLAAIAVSSLRMSVSAQGTLAPRPPMGWNSYNSFGSAVHEDEVRANADYMAQNLHQYGWSTIVVDFLWAYANPPGSTISDAPQMRLADGAYIPWLAMDEWGRLLPNTDKFPSAFGGQGFKPLGDYVHSLGLQFGIHIMRGIPRQAVWARSPVKGTQGITADQIADTNSVCSWNNHMYGLDMRKPGAQEYLNSLLALYAGWGVDFIKVDDISRPYGTQEIEGYRKAIGLCGRPVVLSISPGETPLKDSAHVKQYANMWRMADDFWDSWEQLLKMYDYARSWQGIGGPGHWPDCDMIQIGKISKRGPVGPERYSRFTENELYTHMSFWCIYRSPLMLGGNLPDNRELEKKLFTNDEVLDVDQHGLNPRQLSKTGGHMIWVSDIDPVAGATGSGRNNRASHSRSSGGWYVGLFNIGEVSQDITINFAQLGYKGRLAVRDLWQRQDKGIFKKQYTSTIPPHGVALIKLTAQ